MLKGKCKETVPLNLLKVATARQVLKKEKMWSKLLLTQKTFFIWKTWLH